MRTRTVLGVILIFLALTVRQPALAQGKPNAGDELSSGISISSTACDRSAPEQPIPDDGHWLQVCLLDPLAPEASAVTNVAVKYLIEHPDPDQLEVRLSREDVGISQIMWERGKALAGTKFGKAEELDVFRGTPSKGQWYLWIRDAVPGQSGQLKDVSLVVDYVPTGTLPMLLSGEPGRPTSLRIPPRTVPSKTPDRDKQKSESQGFAPLSLGGWQEVKQETFEGLFPNAGWTLSDANPNDGKEYLWDDDDFRHHNGRWAGWPANGGANGLDPATKPYPPNMASWMTYGPFSLSDAKTAESVFWLWRQIEVSYDYVFFGMSKDSITFNGYKWDGTANWEEKRLSLDSRYLGDSSVWVGWLFVSDNTVQYEGPWVDDILIRKYVPGQVTVQGTLSYSDRNGNSASGRFTKVYLYDQDPGGTDDLLATTTTDANGFFQFPARMNWDDDDSNSDPNNRRLDLYVVFEADYNDSVTSRRRVTNTGGQTYTWPTSVLNNISDGTNNVNVPIQNGSPALGAMWIFQDLRRVWETIYNNTNPHIDPGSVTAKWKEGINCYNLICSSFFWGGAGGPFVFIRQDDLISADMVVHETGHHLMYNATGYWTWWDMSCYEHYLFEPEDVNCAWTEGWGDFLALAVNNTDACFDWKIGPCGAGQQSFENIETPTWGDNRPQGDTVEGRVAGALYDLWDNTNEPAYDSATFGLAPIAKIVLQGPSEERFLDFWDGWKASGQNKYHAVRAIYQNTIDYDTAPRFDPPLPDRTVLQNFAWIHAIDLWGFSTDEESSDWELGWQIVYTSDWHCGVSIDAQGYIDIHPQPGWLGSCDVTVRVSDTLKTADDIFRVNVAPVRGRVYLPIVVK